MLLDRNLFMDDDDFVTRVPLYSEIVPGLWQGGTPEGAAPVMFKFIVNLAPWPEWGYTIQANQVQTRAFLYDSNEMPKRLLLLSLAQQTNAYRRMGTTLVHCQMGLNRSGLITALALMLDGMAASDAINLLREKRSDDVLCNRAFETWLRTFSLRPHERGFANRRRIV